jgi:hypothetical protein
MNDSVQIADGDILFGLKGAVKLFQSSSLELFGEAGQQIRQLGARVASEVEQRRSEVNSAVLRVHAAEAALRYCMGADPPANCSGPAQALNQAQRWLESRQQRLRVAEAASRKLDAAVSAYQGPSNSWAAFLQVGPNRAATALDRLQQTIDRYSAVEIPSSANPLPIGPAGGAGSTLGTPAVSGVRNLPGTDICEVPIGLIDDSDTSISGPSDFGAKGVSYQEMRLGLQRLDESIMPAARRGDLEGFISERSGREPETNYQNLLGSFFGSSAIKLSPAPNGRYSVVNGYHRIFAARELGMTSLPARITGQRR